MSNEPVFPQTLEFSSKNTRSWLEIVDRQVKSLRFGSVQITVHEGRVVQIETSTKVRFDK